MRALLALFELERACQATEEASAQATAAFLLAQNAPASQTLSVLSDEPETMVLPSGEKATDQMLPLCALCFSAFSSREAAASVGALRFRLGEGLGGLGYLHPTL